MVSGGDAVKKGFLTREQAYRAMSVYLERYCDRLAAPTEIGALLGDLEVNPDDGLPMDPAVWDDWLAAVETVLKAPDTETASAQERTHSQPRRRR